MQSEKTGRTASREVQLKEEDPQSEIGGYFSGTAVSFWGRTPQFMGLCK